MDLFNFSLQQLQTFLFIFIRVGALLFFAPIFGSRNVPLQMKVGLTFILSIIVYPMVKVNLNHIPEGIFPMAILMIGEIFIGITIGFITMLIFAGIQLAGNVVGFQMGFDIVNIIDPSTTSQISIIAQLQNIIALLIFLSINAHHLFIKAIIDSFELIPPLGSHFNGALIAMIVSLAGDIFEIAVKVGAPIMATLLFTSVAMGLIARTVPEMNVFIVGFPLKIAVGLLMIGVSLPFFSILLKGIFDGMGRDMYKLLRLMG
ncbi:MAG: flagellar type III secretion system protein FliR [Nitrospinae bacterium]|nr:flagellar type III secretion system protein FliR [Nitrospinota bacterium]